MNWLYKSSKQRITQPYYRIVCPVCYGNNAGGDPLGPGSYWTPRWDSVVMMLRTIFRYYNTSNSMKDSENWKTKIYQIDNAIMDDAPPEHRWGFNYQVDAGEQILVEALSEPKLLYEMIPGDDTFLDLMDYDVERLHNYSNGMKAIWKNQQVYVLPNYEKRAIEVAVPDGWKFKVIKTIDNVADLDKFYGELTSVDEENEDAIPWFIQDMGWTQ